MYAWLCVLAVVVLCALRPRPQMAQMAPPTEAVAPPLRPSGAFFVRPYLGIAAYGSDRSSLRRPRQLHHFGDGRKRRQPRRATAHRGRVGRERRGDHRGCHRGTTASADGAGSADDDRRGRAVEVFYTDRGIDVGRIVAVQAVPPAARISQKDGWAQLRRVETQPVTVPVAAALDR